MKADIIRNSMILSSKNSYIKKIEGKKLLILFYYKLYNILYNLFIILFIVSGEGYRVIYFWKYGIS